MLTRPALRQPPRDTAGPAPVRYARSGRRTSSIDVDWPDGRDGDMRLRGRARDAVTARPEDAPLVFGEDAFEAVLKPDRTILAIASDPPRASMAKLVGARGGGHLRQVLSEVAPEERREATPLHLVLDDISGTSLIAGWAWSQWDADWLEHARQRMQRNADAGRHPQEGVCIGFAPGSSALEPHPPTGGTNGAPGTDLRNADDPEGWHAFPAIAGASLRRARRIDVILGETIRIDAAFQDSAPRPDGGRTVLHEYRLQAMADAGTGRLLSLSAEPRVLPFPECTSAPGNLSRLVGAPMSELRERVIDQLRATAGCTHLNDALRALAEAPALVERAVRTLDGQGAAT